MPGGKVSAPDLWVGSKSSRGLARRAEREFGGLGPFSAEEVAALIGNAFIGAESPYLLGIEKKGIPIRQSLRRFGDLIRMREADSSKMR